ncbi:hypothetical protein TREES_T100020532 [Tupaia chinensis]|uniref:Uncharacterized protein n=1 Tax=Tupaia chinensis TaxID=246437 RepID=L9KW71_TUPCH|nr:hypothetical protein TREES_T100020532 [Tupaia chinensis]
MQSKTGQCETELRKPAQKVTADEELEAMQDTRAEFLTTLTVKAETGVLLAVFPPTNTGNREMPAQHTECMRFELSDFRRAQDAERNVTVMLHCCAPQRYANYSIHSCLLSSGQHYHTWDRCRDTRRGATRPTKRGESLSSFRERYRQALRQEGSQFLPTTLTSPNPQEREPARTLKQASLVSLLSPRLTLESAGVRCCSTHTWSTVPGMRISLGTTQAGGGSEKSQVPWGLYAQSNHKVNQPLVLSRVE